MKPHLKLCDGVPIPADKLSQARLRFGRPFAHERGTSFLRHPEPVLTRWSKNADYWNLDPHKPRPPAALCHFKALRA